MTKTKPIKSRKTPMRRCVGCMESKPKSELVRIVYTPEGDLIRDVKGKANGRGVYLCKNPACLATAKKKKAIQRGIQRDISEEQLNRLFEELAMFEEAAKPAEEAVTDEERKDT